MLFVAGLIAASCTDQSLPTADTSRKPQRSTAKPEFVKVAFGEGTGRDFVKKELERAKSENRVIVIYVGASWCEPCQRFHKAVEEGSLDTELAGVRFLDFDHDEHAEQLSDSDTNCGSKLIPLFSRASEDGTCTDRRVEGGIKGKGAVGFILPKLLEILKD